MTEADGRHVSDEEAKNASDAGVVDPDPEPGEDLRPAQIGVSPKVAIPAAVGVAVGVVLVLLGYGEAGLAIVLAALGQAGIGYVAPAGEVSYE